MKLLATRLRQDMDLKTAICEFAVQQKVTAGVVVAAVGSLGKATIRMAGAAPGQQDIREYEGPLEIVSLIGTVSKDGAAHLHISISNKEGEVSAGHLKEGCIVHTTVELVLACEDSLTFTREPDAETGFDELSIR